MTKYIAKETIEKYLNGTCNEEERAIVESWHLKELEAKKFELEPGQLEIAHTGIWESISRKAGKSRYVSKRGLGIYRYAAIAALLVLCTFAVFFAFRFGRPVPIKELLAKSGKDFSPGGHKAILTLADGSKISLTDAGDGKLGQQAGMTITKTKDGRLIYKIDNSSNASNSRSAVPVFNTINTPRGGKYQVQLPDGTMVWLNAESSLTYPVRFDGMQRKVSMQGEAYFEVAKMQLPFIVSSGNQEVEVLGTHFNINSYGDELNTKTTLLEGSVKVHPTAAAGTSAVMLKPGELSVLEKSNHILVQKADLDHELAWKNDLFIFKEESIESITRKLSRWYDVEFTVKGVPKNISYVGIVSRSKNISSVLSVIESAGNVRFEVAGRRISIQFL